MITILFKILVGIILIIAIFLVISAFIGFVGFMIDYGGALREAEEEEEFNNKE